MIYINIIDIIYIMYYTLYVLYILCILCIFIIFNVGYIENEVIDEDHFVLYGWIYQIILFYL